MMKETQSYLLVKNHEKAHEILKQVYAISWCFKNSDPSLIKIYVNLGSCLHSLDQYAEAIQFLDPAIALGKTLGMNVEMLNTLDMMLKDCIAKTGSEELEKGRQKGLIFSDIATSGHSSGFSQSEKSKQAEQKSEIKLS
jgi:tetratricopeptide (TPR) repeat protein